MVTPTKILLVDDDVELTTMLTDYLVAEGFDVTAVSSGLAAIALLQTSTIALIVLDVMMPSMNGIEVLKRIRSQSEVPVLMLTAKGDETDRVLGLELGADDYLPKPCNSRELVARIRAVLRRTYGKHTSEDPTMPISAGSLSLWPGQRRAELCDQPLELTSTEYDLLLLLTRNAGIVVGKNELSLLGLRRPLSRHDRSIDVHLANIRRKLNAIDPTKERIKTVFRRGYQLVAE